MSPAASSTRRGDWTARSERAETLSAQQTHAGEILRFYVHLLRLQEAIFGWALGARWRADVRATAESGSPLLRLDRLPLRDLEPRFRRFARDIAPAAPEGLRVAAEALRSTDAGTRIQLLTQCVSRQTLESLAASLGCEPPPLESMARAFLQPIAEALVADDPPTAGSAGAADCPRCGWPPLLAVLRDEPDARGRRLLVCSMCATEWPVVRVRCPRCGETRSDQLTQHVSESLPHLKLDECTGCGTYLKSVDLRVDGRAVPLVDDLASVELDLWAHSRGLHRAQPNVLGF